MPEFIWPDSILMNNVEFKVRNMPYSYGVKRLLTSGQYELPERLLLEKVLKESDIVLEMGASIGVVSRIVANKVKKVVAFEASERLVKQFNKYYLSENCSFLQGYIFPVYELPHDFFIERLDNWAGTLGGKVIFSQKTGSKRLGNTFDLKAVELNFAIKPNILIVDIEGSEEVILKFPPRIPLYIEVLLIELHSYLYGLEVRDRIIDNIKAEGFSVTESIGESYLFVRNEDFSI